MTRLSTSCRTAVTHVVCTTWTLLWCGFAPTCASEDPSIAIESRQSSLSRVLTSAEWNSPEIKRTQKAYASMSRQTLEELASATDISVALRALDELYLRRENTPRSRQAFAKRAQSVLDVEFPPRVISGLIHGDPRDGYLVSTENLRDNSWQVNHFGRWTCGYSERSGVMLKSADGVKLLLEDFHVVCPVITGVEMKGALVVGVHSFTPDPFPICCVNLQTRKLSWKSQVFDGDGVGFYGGFPRLNVAMAASASKVVVIGFGVGVIFFEIREIDTGAVIGRYSSWR